MQMPIWSGLLLTVLFLAAFVVVRRHEPPAWQLATGPATAAVILLVARGSGRSWTEIGVTARGAGWAAAAVALTVVVYALALLIPATRRLFRDPRYRQSTGRALVDALIAVPLATVLVEEAAFRGALWTLLGPVAWAAPVLFGLWHVLPGSRTNAAVQGRWALLATFAFTTAAGVLLALLRVVSGGLLAPFVLHWAANGLGVLAGALAARCGSRP
jgi:membrane protease YdiL (CAAX protease family)